MTRHRFERRGWLRARLGTALAIGSVFALGCPNSDPTADVGEAAPCGSRGLSVCPGGSFCKYPESALCGAADAPGVCTISPSVCTQQALPVCGCDGQTYENACKADSAGVSVVGSGACDVPASPVAHFCGGLAGFQCPANTFCDYPLGAQCGAADQGGSCSPVPQTCSFQYDPVCGCDGRTYSNACEAATASVSLSARGQCKSDGGTPDAGAFCGGLLGTRCPSDQYCSYPAEAQCGAADQGGICSPKPRGCGAVYAPVCGCDGKTYTSACAAGSAGITVSYDGKC